MKAVICLLFALLSFSSLNAQEYEEYLLKAKNGDVYSMAVVGQMLRRGDGVKENIAEALIWTKKAAEKQNPIALYNYAVMLKDGTGINKNEKKADQLFKQAFDGLMKEPEDKFHSFCLATIYNYGYGVPEDKSVAFKWYKKSAEHGFSVAQFCLGVMYYIGEGVPENNTEAIKWYKKAAEQGDSDAQFNLGSIYHFGEEGVPQNHIEAIKWYKKAAEQGHIAAQFNLGSIYDKSKEVPQNHTEAVKWFKKAAEQGHKTAQFNLGILYRDGKGVPQNHTEAVKWFKKAAEQGHKTAQFSLGVMYFNGEGVPQNYAEAVKWYKKAAEQGHIGACVNLSYSLYHGLGTKENHVQAVAYTILGKSLCSNEDEENKKLLEENYNLFISLLTAKQIEQAQSIATKMWEKIQANK